VTGCIPSTATKLRKISCKLVKIIIEEKEFLIKRHAAKLINPIIDIVSAATTVFSAFSYVYCVYK